MKNIDGNFGEFGGTYVSLKFKNILMNIEKVFLEAKNDKKFIYLLNHYLKNFVGRPTPLFFAENLSKKLGNNKIYLKREDLSHTGSHKINNTLGQVLLAKRMGAKKIIAETGAGQHGVATATASAIFNIPCTIYMGEKDALKQQLNVKKIKLLGAELKIIRTKSKDLKIAVDMALNDLIKNYKNTFYVLGSSVGPHPYPIMVKFFQSIIGKEIKKQSIELENKLPDYVIACVGGGSNAIGAFSEFIGNKKTILIGVEAGGLGLSTKKHSASLSTGKIGIIHGYKTYIMLNKNNKIFTSYSIASGLNYPAVGPEHSYLKNKKLVEYVTVSDIEALHAFKKLSLLEGIIPAIESSHALAYAMKISPELPRNKMIVVNISGRGDKDMDIVSNF